MTTAAVATHQLPHIGLKDDQDVTAHVISSNAGYSGLSSGSDTDEQEDDTCMTDDDWDAMVKRPSLSILADDPLFNMSHIPDLPFEAFTHNPSSPSPFSDGKFTLDHPLSPFPGSTSTAAQPPPKRARTADPLHTSTGPTFGTSVKTAGLDLKDAGLDDLLVSGTQNKGSDALNGAATAHNTAIATHPSTNAPQNQGPSTICKVEAAAGTQTDIMRFLPGVDTHQKTGHGSLGRFSLARADSFGTGALSGANTSSAATGMTGGEDGDGGEGGEGVDHQGGESRSDRLERRRKSNRESARRMRAFRAQQMSTLQQEADWLRNEKHRLDSEQESFERDYASALQENMMLRKRLLQLQDLREAAYAKAEVMAYAYPPHHQHHHVPEPAYCDSYYEPEPEVEPFDMVYY